MCAGTGCVAGGSLDIYARLEELLQEHGIHCQVELANEPHGDDGAQAQRMPRLLRNGAARADRTAGPLYIKVKMDDCQEIIEKTILGDELIDRLSYKIDGEIYKPPGGDPLL